MENCVSFYPDAVRRFTLPFFCTQSKFAARGVVAAVSAAGMHTRSARAAPPAPISTTEAAQPKTTAAVRRSNTAFLKKPPALTGAAQAAAERAEVDAGWWDTSKRTTTSLAKSHVVVIRDLLPDAERMVADECADWTYTDKEFHNIRNVPLGQDDSNGSGRQSYRIPEGGPIVKALDKRTAPIRQRLGVRRTQIVGIISKPSSCRQIMHTDYANGAYTRWKKKEATQNAKVSPRPKLRFPWTLLLSLQPGGRLIIHTTDGPVVIELGAGDAVLFRYDVRHGGAAYASRHIRLHEYWEPIGAGNIEFRVGVHFNGVGGNQLHAMETGASWNKMSARSNPGTVYRGTTWTYDDVADPDKLIPGL